METKKLPAEEGSRQIGKKSSPEVQKIGNKYCLSRVFAQSAGGPESWE